MMKSKYSNFKNTNSYWIDKVPEHWTSLKNKNIFLSNKEVVGKNWDKYTLLTMGKSGVKKRDLDGGGKFPDSFEKYQIVKPNDLIFCLFDIDETPRTIGISKDNGMITSAYNIFSTNSKNFPNFWSYFYQSIDDYKGLKPFYTGLRNVVRLETFMNIKVYAPPLEEQKLISFYLDNETQKIDNLIGKINKKINLLKEQKTALIDKCTTRGIKNNVEMKNSDIDWINKVPLNWKLKKVSWLSNLVTQGGNPNYSLGKPSEKFRVLKTKSLYNEKIKYKESDLISSETFLQEKKSILIKGDLLIAIVGSGSIGKVNVFEPDDKKDYIYSRSLCCVRLLSSTNPHFLKYFFQSSYGQNLIELGIKGSTGQEVVQTSYISNLKLAIPEYFEQIEIVSFLDKKIKLFNELIKKELTRKIYFEEYRRSLIYSSVTGKIRITEDMI